MDVKKVVANRHFCNKLWNATKFALGHFQTGAATLDWAPAMISEYASAESTIPNGLDNLVSRNQALPFVTKSGKGRRFDLLDSWILHRLHETIRDVNNRTRYTQYVFLKFSFRFSGCGRDRHVERRTTFWAPRFFAVTHCFWHIRITPRHCSHMVSFHISTADFPFTQLQTYHIRSLTLSLLSSRVPGLFRGCQPCLQLFLV
jgi:hypothetical protein